MFAAGRMGAGGAAGWRVAFGCWLASALLVPPRLLLTLLPAAFLSGPALGLLLKSMGLIGGDPDSSLKGEIMSSSEGSRAGDSTLGVGEGVAAEDGKSSTLL